MALFRMLEEFYNDHCQFNKEAFNKGIKLSQDKYYLLVIAEFPKLDFSHLDKESKKEATPVDQENAVPIFVPMVALDEMAIAPFEAAPSVANL